MWIKDINASALSQDQLKEEAKKFSPVFENVNKKTIQRKVEDFIKIDKKELSEVSIIIFKEKGGKEGKKKGRNDIPPETYCPRDFKDFKMIYALCLLSESSNRLLEMMHSHIDCILSPQITRTSLCIAVKSCTCIKI